MPLAHRTLNPLASTGIMGKAPVWRNKQMIDRGRPYYKKKKAEENIVFSDGSQRVHPDGNAFRGETDG